MATNEPNKLDDVINIDPGKNAAKEKAAPEQPPMEAGGDVIVSSDKINKIISEEKAAAREAAQAAEKAATPPEPAKQAAHKDSTAKAEKVSQPEKAPKEKKIPTPEEYKERGQKAAKTRKGNKEKQESSAADLAAAERERQEAQARIEAIREANRNRGPEQVIYLNLSELHAFKDHPFGVRDDTEMKALVESVKNGGVNQPALVRPREGGGYEIIAGHRRQKASELAGYANMPCIVRNMTDDEAILAMTDDNLRQRSEILPSEKAQSLKMQVEAIKHQGARDASGQNVQNKDAGKWSIEVVGERNGMNGKQVQRYIRLTDLVPDLQKAINEGKLGFTSAVEISFISKKNQNFIAVALESEQNKPSLSQAQRMRDLDSKGQLTGDVIDGILCEQKKEVDKVIISGEELNKYFGKDKTPQQMKEQIIKLLDDWSGKQKELAPPVKKTEKEK